MRVPIRKGGKYTHLKPDPHLTEDKFNEVKKELQHLKKIQPEAAAEVKRCAEMGDLSENAAYQIAKGRLRGINQRIIDLTDYLQRVVIIKPADGRTAVELGQYVTVESNGQEKTYLILGSAETDPLRGIISHNSPIGSALMGKRVGETAKVNLKNKVIDYKIIKIKPHKN